MKTRTTENKFEVKEKHYFYSPSKSQIRDDRVFGLGDSFYDPTTGAVQIYSYSMNAPELLSSNKLAFIEYDSTFSHEMGHYQLTTGSRLGNAIKELSVLLDGLCLVIIGRMLNKHSRVWIPFKEYLKFADRDEEIENLITKMHRVERFKNDLIGNWKLSQEMHAYSWSGLTSTLLSSMMAAMFQAGKKEEVFLTLRYFAIDHEKAAKINKTLRNYLEMKGIYLGSIEDTHIKELFEELPGLFGEEADLIELYLNIEKNFSHTYYNRKKDKFKDFHTVMFEYFDKYKSKIDNEFQYGYAEHQRALEIFNDFSRRHPSAFMKILTLIGLFSNLYAPIINPKSVLNSNKPVNFVSFDKTAIEPLKKFLRDEMQLPNPSLMMSSFPKFIGDTNSVKMEDLKRVDLSTVFGTKQWFHSLISLLDLKKFEKNFLKNMWVSYRDVFNHHRGLISSKHLLSHFPLYIRLFIRFFFNFKAITRKFSHLDGMLSFLESMGIKDFKTLFKAIEVYEDFIVLGPSAFSGTGIEKNKEPTRPPLAFFFETRASVLFSKHSLSTIQGRLFMLKHQIGNIKALCLGTKEDENVDKKSFPTILCPASYTGNEGHFCKGGMGNCWLYRLLSASSEKVGMLICCKDGKTNFLRVLKTIKDENFIKSETAFRILDKSNEKEVQENVQDDVIKKIWKPQADRLNKAAKDAEIQRKALEPEFDGKIEDLDNFLVKKLQKTVMPFINFFFRIIRLPLDLDNCVTGLLNKLNEKRTTSCVKKTEMEIMDFIKIIQSRLNCRSQK